MWYCAQAGLVNELAGNTADAICFVLNTHKGFFEVAHELYLAAGELSDLLTLHSPAAVFHIHVAVLGIFGAGFVFAGNEALEVVKLFAGCVYAAHNDQLEFAQFFITVAELGPLCLYRFIKYGAVSIGLVVRSNTY